MYEFFKEFDDSGEINKVQSFTDSISYPESMLGDENLETTIGENENNDNQLNLSDPFFSPLSSPELVVQPVIRPAIQPVSSPSFPLTGLIQQTAPEGTNEHHVNETKISAMLMRILDEIKEIKDDILSLKCEVNCLGGIISNIERKVEKVESVTADINEIFRRKKHSKKRPKQRNTSSVSHENENSATTFVKLLTISITYDPSNFSCSNETDFVSESIEQDVEPINDELDKCNNLQAELVPIHLSAKCKSFCKIHFIIQNKKNFE